MTGLEIDLENSEGQTVKIQTSMIEHKLASFDDWKISTQLAAIQFVKKNFFLF